MLSKRSLPTSLFASPDFFELSSDTVRLILIGVILHADDEGRGDAHPRLLARQLDKLPEEIGPALEELEARGILRCYQVLKRAYYMLTHWRTYQKISRPTPSHYPAPPEMIAEVQPSSARRGRAVLQAESNEPVCVEMTEDELPSVSKPEAQELWQVDISALEEESALIKETETEEVRLVETSALEEESAFIPAQECETVAHDQSDESACVLQPARERVVKREPTLPKKHRKNNPRRRKVA